jgi:hypothetical protein
MSERKDEMIWVAVRIERGFVAEVRAYGTRTAARRTERRWRRRINPDYDETALACIATGGGSQAARHR